MPTSREEVRTGKNWIVNEPPIGNGAFRCLQRYYRQKLYLQATYSTHARSHCLQLIISTGQVLGQLLLDVHDSSKPHLVGHWVCQLSFHWILRGDMKGKIDMADKLYCEAITCSMVAHEWLPPGSGPGKLLRIWAIWGIESAMPFWNIWNRRSVDSDNALAFASMMRVVQQVSGSGKLLELTCRAD